MQMRQVLWMRDMGDKLLILMLTQKIYLPRSLASTTISSFFPAISPKVIKTSSVAYSWLGCFFSNITKDSLAEEEISIGVAPLVAVEYAFPVLLDTTKESLECLLDPDHFLMNNTNRRGRGR